MSGEVIHICKDCEHCTYWDGNPYYCKIAPKEAITDAVTGNKVYDDPDFVVPDNLYFTYFDWDSYFLELKNPYLKCSSVRGSDNLCKNYSPKPPSFWQRLFRIK